MNEQQTQYSNTDLDLESSHSLATLAQELRKSCDVLHCTENDAGTWQMTVEASHDENTCDRDAGLDITAILEAIASVSPEAKKEFDSCSRRDFNIGYECWDSWAYNRGLSHTALRLVVDARCSISWTLYPMRNADGSPRDDTVVG